jgi:predicted house-cleaning NTP pyrophosphatase (Maf/HAM1 superfamily)
MTPDTLLKTDKCTIAVETAPEGKIRVLTTAWAEPFVILADQVLEVRIRQGEVHILRKPRVEDDVDRELRAVNAPYLGDDV